MLGLPVALLVLLAQAPEGLEARSEEPRLRESLSLEDAWKEGLRSAFSLASAQDAVRAAEIGVLQARSRFFPKLTPSYSRGPNERGFTLAAAQEIPLLGGSLTAERSSRTYEGVATIGQKSVENTLTWSQPLLKGAGPNASLFDLRNAERLKTGQERALLLARQRYIVEVARAFYQAQAQRELLAVARQSATRNAALRQASEARLEVGLSNKLDVYRAQLAEAQAAQSAVQSETALQSALETFRYLLGRSPHDAVEPQGSEFARPVEDDLPRIETAVEEALQNRLDLLEVRDQIGDARRSSSLSKQNLLPDVALNLRFTDTRWTGLNGPFDPRDKRWESFLSASLPLERAADFARLQLSSLEVRARERALVQKTYEVEAEVRSTHRELQSLKRSIETQTAAVEIAEQQRKLADLRYQRGLASNFDVVDAEGSLLAARTSLAQLLAAYQVARLDLDRVTGRLKVDFGARP